MAIKLGEILINRGYITPQQLEEALRDQCVSGEPLNKSLVKKGLVNEEHILEALSEQLNIPYIKLQDVTIQPSAVERM
ncbi:MAG: type II secretion system protein GspE, partial [Candidatus Caldatribacteriota bacterium]|nr:type II secretion system protein GspE [Candidatus Caldatribacteriota bacterium]